MVREVQPRLVLDVETFPWRVHEFLKLWSVHRRHRSKPVDTGKGPRSILALSAASTRRTIADRSLSLSCASFLIRHSTAGRAPTSRTSSRDHFGAPLAMDRSNSLWAFGIWHAAHNLGHQVLAGPDQAIQRDRNFHHPGQTAPELFAHVPARRRRQPLDGPVTAHQIDDEECEASAPAQREAGCGPAARPVAGIAHPPASAFPCRGRSRCDRPVRIPFVPPANRSPS